MKNKVIQYSPSTPQNGNLLYWDGTEWSPLALGGSGQVLQTRGVTQSPTWVDYDSTFEVYVGGNFTTAGGVSAKNIAKWDGNNWSALGTGTNAICRTIIYSGGNLYIGGDFSTINGTTANYVAIWDGSSWHPLGSGPGGPCHSLFHDGTNLYAGTTAGSRIAKWDGSSWSTLGTGLTGGNCFSLYKSGNDLYAGGSFTSASGVSARSIAKWDGSSWSALGTGLTGGVGGCKAITSYGGYIYVGGDFTAAGGQPHKNIARWNGSTWGPAPDQITWTGLEGPCNALFTSGSYLYAGGNFSSTSAELLDPQYVEMNNCGYWDGSIWHPLGSGLSAITPVCYAASTGPNSSFIFGGSFTDAGGNAVSNIARYKMGSWSALGSGLNGICYALCSI